MSNCAMGRRWWWRGILKQWKQNADRRRGREHRIAVLDRLESRTLLSGTPIISEFLASNSGGLQDSDGESSDWIEIYNPTDAAIDLTGWSLTDNTGDLNEWQFPNVTLGANQFLTVFASGKNRTSTAELHTNFKLSADGEFLALVDPAGTIVSQYSPAFPSQATNISYGVEFDTAHLVEPGASAQVLVPLNGALGQDWTTTGFTPAGWTSGTTGVGFGVVQPGFNVTYIKANTYVDDLDVARAVINDTSLRSQTVLATAPFVNYMGNGGGGNFGNDLGFPTQSVGDDIDDFVVQAEAKVKIPTAGVWTFGVNSDDGYALRLERNGVVFTSEYFSPRGPGDTLAQFDIPDAGDWNISLIMYERGGGASVELYAAPGAYQSVGGDFRLVGDTAAGGLTVYSTINAGSSVVVGTDLGAAMRFVNSSAYVRVPFDVSDPAAFDSLLLKMRYDDGFVAYLNGVEVARRNAPANLSFDSSATTDRTLAEATTPETINLTPFLHLLQSGNNVLAIQGLNSSPSDDSFLVLPELTASAVHPDQFRYFATVTPGNPNVNPALGVIERVTANVAAGFYDAPISVSLSTVSAGAEIRYTTDGSTPSPTNGIVYTGPITVSSTTTLRAGAFRTDYISLPTITRTYLFLDDVIHQSPSDDVPGGDPDMGAPPPGWPASWGNNIVDYGIDQTVVQQEGADRVKAALLAIPSLSITTDLANLFDPSSGIYSNAYNDGRDWERAASVELLNPDGTPGFQVNAGLRIRGGYSRSGDNPKHAFRLFFRGEYGDSTLEYPLFGDEGVNSFKKMDLRTAQNYSWSFGGDPSNTMIQDVFARESQGAMGEPYTRSRWYHLYIDGQYWGIYQTQERAEAEYAASYLGGTAADYDVIKPEAGPYQIYATDGNLDAYQRLWQFVTSQNLADNANYFHIQGMNVNGIEDPAIPNQDVLLDVDNLIVYMIGTLHGGNLDAPISAFLGNQGVNNFFAVRDRTGRTGFQYFQHDAEHTLHNIYEDRNGPFPAGQSFDRFNPQFLHQQLMANAEYRQKFADAIEKYFFNDGPMTVANAQARFQQHVDILDQAIIAESARWGDSKRPNDPLDRADWLNAVSAMLDGFLANRNEIFLAQLRAYGLFPDLSAPQFLVNGSYQNSGEVEPGSLLRFAASGGLVYYTLDGSDPRLVGGGINPAAQIYDPASVSSSLVSAGSSWKYFDLSANAPAGWAAKTYDDAAWQQGNAEFGYGDGDEATTIGFGPDADNKFVTSYYRKSFTVADTSTLTGLLLRLKRDDGAVVYINGVEAVRSNMPAGTIDSGTFAATTIGGGDEQAFYEYQIDPGLLVDGVNVIAVEVHQSVANSSDVSFDAELIATVQNNPGVPVNASGNFRARAFDGTNWSAIEEASFSTSVPAAAGNLAITEVNYNPVADPGSPAAPFNDKENFEFIELRNTSAHTIDLTGVQFTVGITFDFTGGDVLFLAPGEHVLVVKNRQAFEHRYGTGLPIAGVYSGNLSNGGEEIKLVDAQGATIQDFTYDDDPATTPPWPVSADGGGFSLTVRNVAGNYNLPSNWRASLLRNGTPGYEENVPPENLALSQTSVAENVPDATVGQLSATDLNAGDTISFSLLPGGDGGQFVVVGNELRVGAAGLSYLAGATRTVTVRATDPHGASIDRTFTINVLDTTAPSSAVNVLPAHVTTTDVPLSWSGSADVAHFDIYVSDNGGAYSLLLGGTTVTSTTFTGAYGHTYRFYSVATDLAGNVEADPQVADATTIIDPPAPPVIVQSIVAVSPNPRETAVNSLDFTFSDAITSASLTTADLSLSFNGGANLLTGTETITLVSGTTWRITGLAGLTAANGTYTFVVGATGVTDAFGLPGVGSESTSWTVNRVAPTITALAVVDPNPTNVAVDSLDVTFSELIDPASFDFHDLTLVREGTSIPLGTAQTVTFVSGTTWRIGGLGRLTNVDGRYTLTVSATDVQDLAGIPGTNRRDVSWKADFTRPTASAIERVRPDVRNTPLDTLLFAFSEKVRPESVDLSDLRLTRNGQVVPFTAAQTVSLAYGNTWRIEGLASLTQDNGRYVLTSSSTGILDLAGNAGNDSISATWLMDTVAPQSRVLPVPAPAPGSRRIVVSIEGTDPAPAAGVPTSGISRYELYVAIDGKPFTWWRSLNASTSSAVTPAEFDVRDNHTYTFRSIAYDNAGNVEANTGSARDATFETIDRTPPVTKVTAVNKDQPVFVVTMQGTDSGWNGALSSFELYVSIDGAAAERVAVVSAGSPNANGVYTAQAQFQAKVDGATHTYRFYSIGKDAAGRVEAPPIAPAGVVVSATYTPNRVTGFDVEQGASQRSLVRIVDLVFSRPDDVAALVATIHDGVGGNDRLRLSRVNVSRNTREEVGLAGQVSASGNRIRLDFGSGGLSDGYYELGVDLDGNGTMDKLLHFHRLQGDFSGDGRVDYRDTSLLAAALGRTGSGLPWDLSGNGRVDAADLIRLNGLMGRQVAVGLPRDD